MATLSLSRDKVGTIVPHELTLDLYRKMLTTFYVDDCMKVFSRQGKCTFHASARVHEKTQIGMTLLMNPRQDWFFTYYREKGIPIGLGMPLRDIFLAMLSRGAIRTQRAEYAGAVLFERLNLVAQTDCTGTQFLPAAGMVRALVKDHSDAVVYVSSGEGATSEGEFLEALNLAAHDRPSSVVRDPEHNGYAISVPQSSQTVSEIKPDRP
jgi:2-oxoisovalerate dehydrogenase E1 component